jgi:hypothetical protein
MRETMGKVLFTTVLAIVLAFGACADGIKQLYNSIAGYLLPIVRSIMALGIKHELGTSYAELR